MDLDSSGGCRGRLYLVSTIGGCQEGGASTSSLTEGEQVGVLGLLPGAESPPLPTGVLLSSEPMSL